MYTEWKLGIAWGLGWSHIPRTLGAVAIGTSPRGSRAISQSSRPYPCIDRKFEQEGDSTTPKECLSLVTHEPRVPAAIAEPLAPPLLMGREITATSLTLRVRVWPAGTICGVASVPACRSAGVRRGSAPGGKIDHEARERKGVKEGGKQREFVQVERKLLQEGFRSGDEVSDPSHRVCGVRGLRDSR